MIREICDSYEFEWDNRKVEKENTRYVTFEYRTDEANDERVLELIKDLINREVPTCFNCVNYYRDALFSGYSASCCKIHGCIEQIKHPHYDCDGSKCDDYRRKE